MEVNDSVTSSTLNTTKLTDLSIQENLDSNVKQYNRDELIYLARLNEKIENSEEAFYYTINFVRLKPVLSNDERNLFNNICKSFLNIKRKSHRYFKSQVLKETKKGKFENVKYLGDLIDKIELEINSVLNLTLELIDTQILPNSKKIEAQVFYHRLKADLLRYKVEVSNVEEKEIILDLAEQSYNEAYMLSEENLPISSIVRVGLAVNFSLFYYNHRDMIEEALIIAKTCFEEACKVVDEIDEVEGKDYILLAQLLKENIVFWTSERSEEESSYN